MAGVEFPMNKPAAPGPIIDRIEAKDPADVPGGIRGPFFQEIGKRKLEGRDAKTLVTAKDGQTGVGKSNCCDFLGYVCDTSEDGFQPYKTTIDPYEFINMYGRLPLGSSSIMEEGEQFDSRRGMTNENVDAAEKWQMARVREICAFVNLPSPSTIDTRFERLADYWINVERRGRAMIYKKRIHPTKRQIYYETLQTLEWPNMDKSETFRHMDGLKGDHLDDEGRDGNWVRESEVQDRIDRAKNNVRKEVRDEWIKALKRRGMSGSEIASLSNVDIKGARVNQIARGE